jgi:hypothetical protein
MNKAVECIVKCAEKNNLPFKQFFVCLLISLGVNMKIE